MSDNAKLTTHNVVKSTLGVLLLTVVVYALMAWFQGRKQ